MAKGRVYGHVVDRSGNVVGSVRDLQKGAAFGTGLAGLRIDTRQIARMGEVFAQAARQQPVAFARALNRTAEETRTAVKRALVTQTGLPSGEVLKALSVTRANAGHLSAAIVARGSYAPLGKFSPRRTAKGVSANPWGVRRVFPHTFTIAKFGGNVYKRVGKARFPLHKLYGPAVPVELPRDQSKAAFFFTVPPVLAKRLEHELGRLLG